MKHRVLGLLLAFSLLGLSACHSERPQFKSVDITGADYASQLDLPDASGQMRHLSDFKGKVVAVFFGYTQCPDVCPTTLAELAEVKHALGAAGSRLQVLFVSLDPERDTPDVLKAYVTSFDPRFLGLSGTPEQIKQAANSFKAFYAKSAVANGTYSMDHTASFYLIDPKGESRVLLNNNAGAKAIVHDVGLVLR